LLTGGSTPVLIGYARVSTEDQHLDLQRDALARAGCERTFEDRRSGVKADRPGLAAALDFARPGDSLVVWRLDRLGRSLTDLIALVRRIRRAFRYFWPSCVEDISASSPVKRRVLPHARHARAERPARGSGPGFAAFDRLRALR
jgi:hypothetical protein